MVKTDVEDEEEEVPGFSADSAGKKGGFCLWVRCPDENQIYMGPMKRDVHTRISPNSTMASPDDV